MPSFASSGLQAAMLQAESKRHLSFIKPFTWTMWVALFLLWIFYSLNLTFISFVSQKLRGGTMLKEDRFSFLQSFWFFSIVAIQFGVIKKPKSLGGKMLTFTWGFFTLTLVATYTANLAAFFSKEIPDYPLKTVQDIVDSKYNAAALDSDKNSLPTLGNKVLNELLDQNRISFDVNVAPVGDPVLLKNIDDKLHSDHVWISSESYIEGLQKNIPDLYKLEGYFKYVAYGFAVREDWKWARAVKEKFIQFGKNGFFYDVNQNYETKITKKMNRTRPIDVQGYFELFAIMVVTAALSSLLLVLYYFYQQKLTRVNKRKRKQQK